MPTFRSTRAVRRAVRPVIPVPDSKGSRSVTASGLMARALSGSHGEAFKGGYSRAVTGQGRAAVNQVGGEAATGLAQPVSHARTSRLRVGTAFYRDRLRCR